MYIMGPNACGVMIIIAEDGGDHIKISFLVKIHQILNKNCKNRRHL